RPDSTRSILLPLPVQFLPVESWGVCARASRAHIEGCSPTRSNPIYCLFLFSHSPLNHGACARALRARTLRDVADPTRPDPFYCPFLFSYSPLNHGRVF